MVDSHGIAATEQSDARQELHELGEYTEENKVGLKWEPAIHIKGGYYSDYGSVDCIVFPLAHKSGWGLHILRKADSDLIRGSHYATEREAKKGAADWCYIFMT